MAGRDPHPAPRVQMDRVTRPYLLPIRINGIACDADAIGGPSSIYGYGEPADDQDSRRGPRLNLHIQGGIGWACGEGTQDPVMQDTHRWRYRSLCHFPGNANNNSHSFHYPPGPGLPGLQSMHKPAYLLGAW